MYFSSKKDVWLFLIFWGIIIFIILANLFGSDSVEKLHITDGIWGYLMGTLIVILLSWLWFGTGYKVEEGFIKIYFGPFRSKVKIQEIKSLRKTNNPFSAPALSIDRLEILHGPYNVTMISPKKRRPIYKIVIS